MRFAWPRAAPSFWQNTTAMAARSLYKSDSNGSNDSQLQQWKQWQSNDGGSNQ
jgi:hypothetical protein